MGQAQAATKVDVIVTARRDDSKHQRIDWTLEYRIHPPGHGKAKGRDVDISNKGAAEFRFDLDDRSGFDLSFKENGAAAIFVAPGTACPPSPGDAGGEFVINPATSKQKASMIDCVSKLGDFSYQLNFDSNDGEKNCDPIIRNVV